MESKTKVLMLPWLAYGHITPFVELAKKLSQINNFHIYLCSSPINLQSIKTRTNSSIELVELNLTSSLELPPHFHTTNGLPFHLILSLFKAFDTASPHFSSILEKLQPDFIISDVFSSWATQLASSFNIPVIPFLVTSAAVNSSSIYRLLNDGTQFPFPEMDLRNHWIGKKHYNRQEEDDEDSLVKVAENRYFQWVKDLKLCSNIIFVNSFVEIEGKYIDYLSNLLNKKIIPIGPLIQESESESKSESDHIMDWLEKKEPKSTIYVSFGSEYYLSKEDMEEVAYGLELSGANFIWVIRFPKGEKEIKIEEELPNGFLGRIREKGMVVNEWVPQLKILKHKNIGGFVSHCGWNSVIESVVIGVPIIALPMQIDQPFHAKVVEGAGVGVEAERDDDLGSVKREGVAKAIKEVVFEKMGEDLREKVREVSEILKWKEGQIMEGLVVELDQMLCEATRN